MSVPKSRRKPSHFEVFHNATELQKEVVLYVMQDFGVTQDTSLAEAHFLDLKFERIVNVCGDIIGDTNRANKMFVTNIDEYKARRMYQDKAIGSCEVLKQEIQSIIDIIPNININKYVRTVDLVQKEINLIKAWRKSDIRLKKRLK